MTNKWTAEGKLDALELARRQVLPTVVPARHVFRGDFFLYQGQALEWWCKQLNKGWWELPI